MLVSGCIQSVTPAVSALQQGALPFWQIADHGEQALSQIGAQAEAPADAVRKRGEGYPRQLGDIAPPHAAGGNPRIEPSRFRLGQPAVAEGLHGDDLGLRRLANIDLGQRPVGGCGRRR